MKANWKNVLGMIALSTSLLAVPAMAQDGPPPRDGQGQGDRPPRGGDDQGPPQGGDMGPPPGGPNGGGPNGDRPPRMNDGNGPGGMRPVVTPEQRRSEVMRGYLELVERYAKLASDPDAAAISAILTGTDMVRPQGPAAIAEYLEGLLKETKRPAVVTAIRLQLIDAYKTSRDNVKAMAHIRALITDAGNAPTAAPSTAAPARQ